MSLNQEQLREHCELILKESKIRNKIVVLCEGKITDKQGRLSPQVYKQMEKMPDANFYRACVPRWWTQNTPEFFNCGDRNDVLNTYFTLKQLHDEMHDETNPKSSYLSPDKLFAIVDLDNQVQNINDYSFANTEEIFFHLYQEGKVNKTNTLQHRIWVTGLIHKEAYFLIPELQPIFEDEMRVSSTYRNNPLCLDRIYLDICRELKDDPDVQKHFSKARDRIRYCDRLDLTDINTFSDSWKAEFQSTQDSTRKHELVFALLTISKAKKYWKEIQPDAEWTGPLYKFKDQLSLAIAREFYSHQENENGADYHLPSFFQILHQFV